MKEYRQKHFPKCSAQYTNNSVYLHPGEYHFATKPTMIHTILGSCVSVVLYDQAHQFGAMCHAVLDSVPSPQEQRGKRCYKYMDCVLEEMIHKFRSYGIAMQSLRAKVFGGAQMLLEEEREMASAARPGVGVKNAQMALQLLQQYGCKVEAQDVGGYQGRKIYFLSHDGDVYLKRVQKSTG